jgi:hypothetical protein
MKAHEQMETGSRYCESIPGTALLFKRLVSVIFNSDNVRSLTIVVLPTEKGYVKVRPTVL